MSNGLTSRAIAYLKPDLLDVDSQPALELSQADSFVFQPLTSGLLVTYVVDEESAFRYIQNRHLDGDGVSANELHRIAIDNLSKLAYSGNLQIFPHPGRIMFAAIMGGNFEASLILVDELWDDTFRQFVQGDYAVAIPARDVLTFCDSNSSAGLDELRQVIERVFPVADHALCDKVFFRRHGRWDPASV